MQIIFLGVLLGLVLALAFKFWSFPRFQRFGVAFIPAFMMFAMVGSVGPKTSRAYLDGDLSEDSWVQRFILSTIREYWGWLLLLAASLLPVYPFLLERTGAFGNVMTVCNKLTKLAFRAIFGIFALGIGEESI